MRAYLLRHICFPLEGHEHPRIEIGEYDGHTNRMTREFAIQWHDIGDRTTPALEIFAEAWVMFDDYNRLFHALAGLRGRQLDVEAITMVLNSNGFIDQTDAWLIRQGMPPRRNPRGN